LATDKEKRRAPGMKIIRYEIAANNYVQHPGWDCVFILLVEYPRNGLIIDKALTRVNPVDMINLTYVYNERSSLETFWCNLISLGINWLLKAG
jgi:hypothetical protein